MDDMEEVTQRFTADVEEWVHEVGRAATEARELAGKTEEVKLAADGMRDKVAEAAAALKITRDEMGKLRNAQGEVITASEAQAMALKHVRDQALEAAFAMRELDKYEKPSLFSRLKGGLGGLLGGGGGGEGPGGLAGGLGSLSGIGGMLLAVEGAVMVIGPEVMALVTGLSAAGLGVASFAALAAPAFGKVHSAMTQIQADQQAYDRALTSKQRATAMAHLKQDWASLDPAQAGAVRGVQQITGEFQQMAKAFEPTAFKVFGQVLQIAGDVMPQVQMFATAAAPAIEQVLSGLGKFVTGTDFSQFMAFLQSLSGPAIKGIASGFKGIAEQVMQMMERFSKKDVLNAINIAFRVLGFSLRIVDGLIVGGMKTWDMLTGALHLVAHYFDDTRHAIASFAHLVAHYFDDVRHAVATWAHDIAHWFDDVRHFVAGLAHDIAVWFDRIRHDIAHWVDNVVTFFKNLPGNVLHALGNLGKLLLQAGKDVVNGLLNGIKDAAGGLLNFVEGIAGNISSAFKSALGIFSPSRVFFEHGRNTLLGYIQGIMAAAPMVHAALASVGGHIAAGGLPGIAGVGAGGAGGASVGHATVNITAHFAAGTDGLNNPRFLQYIQTIVQEATLRYNVNNPGNGLAIATGGRL